MCAMRSPDMDMLLKKLKKLSAEESVEPDGRTEMDEVNESDSSGTVLGYKYPSLFNIYSRLMMLYHARKLSELGERLEVNTQMIYHRFKDRTVDPKWILIAVMNKMVNPFWILYGDDYKNVYLREMKDTKTPKEKK